MPTCRVEYGLRSGVGIGVRGMAGTGTLGAFLTDGHDYYLLSCNHVLFKQHGALTAEQTLGDEKADGKNSGEEKPAETGELESVAKPQTAESDFVEKIRAAEKILEELRKKDNLETDAITALEAELGMLMVRDAISDARKRLETAESDSVEEQGLKYYTSDDANSKIESEEIRRLKSQIRVPKEGEILIEHPAKEDVIAEVSKCQKNIKSKQTELEKQRGEENNATKRMIFEIEAEKFRLVQLLDQLPRCIATYVGGYQDNFSHDKHDIFVDAGIAKLCDDQRDEILAGNCKPYGKRTITGEVVSWEEIRQEPDGTKFWKFGAKTGLTEGGEFRAFGFNFKDRMLLSNFCEGCAKNMRCVSFKRENPPETCVCRKCQREITQTERKYEIFGCNCFLVKSKRKDFSDHGDFGAVIFDEENRAWGIIVGVFLLGDSSFSVVCSLDIALKALRKEIGKPNLRLWTGVAGK